MAAFTAHSHLPTGSGLSLLLQAWDKLGVPGPERLRSLGPLVGTHAHEMSSVVQQLLAVQDHAAGACRTTGKVRAGLHIPVAKAFMPEHTCGSTILIAYMRNSLISNPIGPIFVPLRALCA